ncbi:MAG: metallophosphoesterase [Chloroflexi bacterium]|nr:MAG: metallophosphoesterase [Chloroflexota bacterium]
MRCAILADIHGNLAAFEAVLEDVERRGGFDEIWCLGDVVGYGPDPSACVQLLRQHRHICIAGNHDWAAIGNIDTSYFNPYAAAAAHWTAEHLAPEDIDYLRSLPQTVQRDDFTLAHGSPREPIWEYVLSTEVARVNFSYFDTRFCLIGHSHVPVVFALGEAHHCELRQLPDELLLSQERDRLIINCGAVGQPRDGDPRASYAILDTEKLTMDHYRVVYDIAATQDKILKAGLPPRLAHRLSQGW